MQDISTLISSINFKIHTLYNNYQQEKQKNAQLSTKNEALSRLVAEQQDIIKNLEEANKVLKLGNAVSNSKDSIEMRSIINELVKEINKCIGLLTQAG